MWEQGSLFGDDLELNVKWEDIPEIDQALFVEVTAKLILKIAQSENKEKDQDNDR